MNAHKLRSVRNVRFMVDRRVMPAAVTECTASRQTPGYPRPDRGRTSMPSIIVLGHRRAVAELDATIERIDEQRRGQLAAAGRLGAARGGPAQAPALLRPP